MKQVKTECNLKGQEGPLGQRLDLLESVVKESARNTDLMADQADLSELMCSGTLVVADLTDPMLPADEANGIFQVLLEQFRNKHLPGVGKVVAFDEAHKYLTPSSGGGTGGKDELSYAITNTVRMMRHEGIRILISTQSPLALPQELLELVSMTVIHHFQSQDWYEYLKSKIPIPVNGFDIIKKLTVGEALITCSRMEGNFRTFSPGCEQDMMNEIVTWLEVKMRKRITADYGSSKLNL